MQKLRRRSSGATIVGIVALIFSVAGVAGAATVEFVYDGLPLPSIFLPTRVTNLLHGSCRKMHGPGEDALPIADDVLGETATNLEKRPAMFFMTGDQIYSDDVPGPL